MYGHWRALLVVSILATAAGAAEPPRPNLLVLITDDQRWDTLGAMGHVNLKTPHIDRLAARGALFENAFVTTSICCVSRACYYTGLYARNHRVGDFSTPLPADVLAASYPALLKQAGYRTGCLGKWGLGGPEPRQVFDEWYAWGGQGEFFTDVEGRTVHNSALLAEHTEAFLRGNPAGRPFCLTVLYKSPHEPYLPDPQDAPLFRDETFPLPRTYTDADFDRRPEFIRRSEGRIRLQRDCPTPDGYQEFVRQYLRCLAGVDRSVGRIMSVLDELGLAENTVVVYTSDNGFCLGDHGLSGKWLMYEESIRVPLVICDPRLPAALRGRRLQEMALNIDLAPTLLSLAGAEVPPACDGRSLTPLLQGQDGKATPWRGDFFYEHHFDNGGSIPSTEGVRTAEWKYTKYVDIEPAYEELYDLRSDPCEETNLASDRAHRERLEQMRSRYRQYVERLPPAALPQR